MRTIRVDLDADLVIEVMLLVGTRDPQDAVEVVVRDYLARGHRTEAITGNAVEDRRRTELKPPPADGG